MIHAGLATKRYKLFFIFGSLVSSFILSLFFHSSISHAATIDDLGPTTGSSTVNGSPSTPWSAVGVGSYNGKESWFKIYIPSDTKNATVNIQQACYLDVGSPRVEYTLFSMHPDETINTEGFKRTRTNEGTCQSNLSAINILSNGTESDVSGHQEYRVFYIRARILNLHTGSGNDHERSFRVNVNGSGVRIGASTYQNTANGSIESNYFGVYQRDANPNRWSYEVEFAPQCNDSSASGRQYVFLWDLDQGVSNYNQNISVNIQEQNRSGGSWTTANGYQDYINPTNGGSGVESYASFVASSTKKYKLRITGVGWRNTLQIALPYDQIDAWSGIDCNPPQGWKLQNNSDVYPDQLMVVSPLEPTATNPAMTKPTNYFPGRSCSAYSNTNGPPSSRARCSAWNNYYSVRTQHTIDRLSEVKFAHTVCNVDKNGQKKWTSSDNVQYQIDYRWYRYTGGADPYSPRYGSPNPLSDVAPRGCTNAHAPDDPVTTSSQPTALSILGDPSRPAYQRFGEPETGDRYCEQLNVSPGTSTGGSVPRDYECVTLSFCSQGAPGCTAQNICTQAANPANWSIDFNADTLRSSGSGSAGDAWVGDRYDFYYDFGMTNGSSAKRTSDINFRRFDRDNGGQVQAQSWSQYFTGGLGNGAGAVRRSISIGPEYGGQTFGSYIDWSPATGHWNEYANTACWHEGSGSAEPDKVIVPYFYHLYPKATVSAVKIQQSEAISVTTTMTQPNENNEPGTNDIGRPHTYTDRLNYRTVECTLPSGTQPWGADSSANTYHWTDSGLAPTAFGASKGGQGCQEISGLGGNDRVWRNNILNESINSDYETRNGSNTILPVGTKVCYFLSVNHGTYDALNGPSSWRHSEPSCTTITKSPKVRFENTDVLTGRHIPKNENDGSCDALNEDARILATGATAYTINNYGFAPVNQTGSWGEYGVFATGHISGLGSAAFAYGQSANDIKKLHFANTPTSGNFRSYGNACTFNWFEKLTKNPETVGTDDVKIEDLVGKTSQYSKDRSWNVSASSPLNDVTTPTILYAKATATNSCTAKDGSGVIEITSDINYKASYPNIKDVPRVILMADCGIIIHKNVRNLDVGLITRETINTCDMKDSNGAKIALDTDKHYQLTKDDCNQSLTVTGPVVTKKINLLRTWGSDMAQLPQFMIIPAENFAQNPSYLISTYEQARQKVNLTVEYQDELPPRY